MTMSYALAESLAMLAEVASGATSPWWIIGSAAVVLQGCSVPHVKDIALLMSAADADHCLRLACGMHKPTGTDQRFRSMVFGIWEAPPVPVEVFGGFTLATSTGWREVKLTTREAVTIAGHQLSAPSAEELMRLLREFGRPKDLERARALAGE
jgi:hypothetical protein